MEKKISTQKITPCLWFNAQAEEAVDFYLTVFNNASKGRVSYYSSEGQEIHGMQPESVLTIEFDLEGQTFLALNGGPDFKFNEAVSFIINCKDQAEVDYYWDKLKEGGDEKAQICGWLKDKFGVSWQVTPTIVADMLQDKDSAKTSRMMAKLMKMRKLDVKELQDAFDGK
jgi:predicted 3-demethylubiquinone-9 3-methyltransferase (glyoxalase superfamily)